MSALLEVCDLAVDYDGVTAVSGISFSLQRGQVMALLGANGAGKTTILKAVCGAIRSQGTVRLDDQPIKGRRAEVAARLGIAHVPDDRGTFASLTVEENLALGAITRRGAKQIRSDMDRVYMLFPRLAERPRQQAGLMSGGEQQMLAIGRALMLRPKLMLLDEPSFGLAPGIVREVFATLATLKADKVSMLLVEQNASLALTLADHVSVLQLGRIVLSGPAEALRNEDSVRRAYLAH